MISWILGLHNYPCSDLMQPNDAKATQNKPIKVCEQLVLQIEITCENQTCLK